MLKLVKYPLLLIVMVIGVYAISFLNKQTHDNLQAGKPLNISRYGNIEQAEKGQIPDPNYQISFPSDHAQHRDFDIEWWYLTANLQDQNKHKYGLQWTLFRFRNPTQNQAWGDQHIYMAHASVHSTEQHWFKEKFARGGVGNAGQLLSPFTLFIDDWRLNNTQNTNDLFPSTLQFSLPLAKGEDPNNKIDIEIALTQTGPFVKHGENGFSIKSGSSSHASHYYSAPFIRVNGTITRYENNAKIKKTITGDAWFDQEWTSQLIDKQTLGWDWLSLHLDDGSKLMAFRMRLQDQPDYITGSYITADGELTTLNPSDIDLKPVSISKVGEKKLPLSWAIEIPSKQVSIIVHTVKDDQWNPSTIAYYEGMLTIQGSHNGHGFLELTGY